MSAHQAGATTLTQQSENFGYSAVRLRRIVKLQFGIVNPAELVGSGSRVFFWRRVCDCGFWSAASARSYHSNMVAGMPFPRIDRDCLDGAGFT